MKLSAWLRFGNLRLLALLTLLACVVLSGLGCTGSAPAASTTTYKYFAYITNQGDNTVTAYSMDQNTYALTRLNTVATGKYPSAVKIVSNYAYVANTGDNTISQYSIDSAGNLTPLNPPNVTSGAGPVSFALFEYGKNNFKNELLVANVYDNTISEYVIGSDGTLSSIKSVPSGGIGPVRLGQTDLVGITVLSTGDAAVRSFTNDFSGGLIPNLSLNLPSGDALVDMDPTGSYVVDTTKKAVYYIHPAFPLKLILDQTLSFKETPVSVAYDPDGLVASYKTDAIYVATDAGKIYQFQKASAPDTSTITPQTAATISLTPQKLTLCSSTLSGIGHAIFVLLGGSNTVQAYDANSRSISATHMTQATTGNGPSAIDIARISAQSIVAPPVTSTGPNVLVADAGNGRIVGMDKIPPTSFTGYGTFYSPYSVAFDAQGRIYIGDYQPGSSTITRVDDLKGTNKTVYAPPGSTSSIVYVDKAGKIYFRDDNQKINRMDDMTGKNLVSIGAPAVNLGSPNGIAVDSKNRIYVTDGDHQVIRFDDMTGKNLISFGTIGNGTGQFSGIQGLAIDSSDRIYIADGNNARIVRIDNVDSGANWTAYTIPLNAGNLVLPRSIAVSGGSTPIIYFVDGASTAIYKMEDMTGKNLIPYGTSGAGSGQFSYPAGIAAK